MNNVIVLPRYLRRRKVAALRRHVVTIRIIDTEHPRHTRWQAQRHVQNAAGFRANRGFTDQAVLNGYTHRFRVRAALLARFMRGMKPLLIDGLVMVTIDGQRQLPRRDLQAA